MDEIIFLISLLIMVTMLLVSLTFFFTYHLGELDRSWDLVERNRNLSFRLFEEKVDDLNASGEICLPYLDRKKNEPTLLCY
ncbi:MAG: hypothetical protein QW507_00495 [Candidatus Nanoarchaeia archaeon]|nr:hypothetical protein [Candidatus Haiyanarchaeum thermophilum]MCW1302940.1 hypothetical protein [Candidatus Haiyanarchaeum thermophilum]MCW1303618.1 hypothetical protein [Candidatus Haiyanarchaeum thermophilum]MCW1306299.1 hypothetical protein [Candidatus Haiyanarchaeum thermophilum]MCW1307191.1 hypothetical protein [Candidatus Haiyanarchaeum thermophilum]